MADPSTRAERKQRTREALVSAARAAFESQGFEATTIRDIARRARVATGTVFVHFADKHALLARIFDEQLRRVLQEASRSVPASGTKNQLLHFAERLYRHYAERPELSRVLVKESLFLRGAPGELLDTHLVWFLARVQELVAAGAARGEVRGDIDPAEVARMFFGIYFTTLVGGLRGELGEVDDWVRSLDRALTLWVFPGAQQGGGGQAR